MTQRCSEEIFVCRVLDKAALKGRVGEVLVDGESLLKLLRVGVNLCHFQAAFVSENQIFFECQIL